MKSLLLILISFILLQCSLPPLHQSATITEHELYDHISFLASDDLEGRKPGTPQCDSAAAYIEAHFQQLGLQPMDAAGYQYFQVITAVKLGSQNHLTAAGLAAIPGENYTPLFYSKNTQLTAELVFAGYGFQIANDSINWNDYQNINAQGKWVMLLRGTPENEATFSKYDPYATLRRKLLVARDQGAAGVLFVSGEKYDAKDELMALRIDHSFSRAELPVLHIKRNLADALLQPSGHTIHDLEQQLDSQLAPASLRVNTTINAQTDVAEQEVKTQNVVALLPGSDPILKDEYLVVGAHYDHLGWGGKGSGSRRPDTVAVHNGADDNASGVAAILEIAERLALNKEKPKRSILFMSFGAEEMGLLGSSYFTSHPLIKLSQIKQMFNLDMVGRLNPVTKRLTIGGVRTGRGLAAYIDQQSKNTTLKLSLTPDGYGPSDHASFYIKNIPVLYFFTGITEEYHTPADDIETINFSGEKQVADFAYDLIFDMASRKTLFPYQEAGPKGPPKSGKRGKVKMGVIPDFAAADSRGFLLGGIVANGPAALAGMQGGDVMISIDGGTIKNIYDYMERMADVKPGQRITVEVLRQDQKLILIVQL